MKIKKFLRRFVPASRTYIDTKFRDLERTLKQELNKQYKQENQFLISQLNEYTDKLQKSNTEIATETTTSLIKLENDHFTSLKKHIETQQHVSVENLRKYILSEQNRTINCVRGHINLELSRRDKWAISAAENKRIAAGRPIWVIKCPAPEGKDKVTWGDYPFALALQKYLERLNCYVLVDTREDWGCEEGADVVLVLRGCHFYRPDRRNPDTLYIMWNISHPDMITTEEYRLYDIVCVASRHYAKKLESEIDIPVIPLLQCTDTEVFFPANKNSAPKWDYIFIGNSRGVARSCVIWAIEKKLPLRMWGSGWNYIIPDHMDLFEAPSVENSELPDLYRSAKVTLNDHWSDMLDKQFVNNRIFDALACGLPVISDVCDELREIFPDAVLYYETQEDFNKCISMINDNYDQIKKSVLEQQELIRSNYSFEARAKQLVDIAKKFKSSQP